MADPTYTNWKDLRHPVGCSRCGALVADDMTTTHTAYHAAQDAIERKVNENSAAIVKINGVLGIKVL